MNKSAIVYERGDRLVVDTSHPRANMMHDASRPFAVCTRLANTVGRVICMARYETLDAAKRAARYLK
jgi:hypothetical protein